MVYLWKCPDSKSLLPMTKLHEVFFLGFSLASEFSFVDFFSTIWLKALCQGTYQGIITHGCLGVRETIGPSPSGSTNETHRELYSLFILSPPIPEGYHLKMFQILSPVRATIELLRLFFSWLWLSELGVQNHERPRANAGLVNYRYPLFRHWEVIIGNCTTPQSLTVRIPLIGRSWWGFMKPYTGSHTPYHIG